MPGKYKVSPPEERRALGRTFGSKAEMRYALTLESMKEAGLIIAYVCQPKLWLGVPEYTYTPDFIVCPSPEEGKTALPYFVDVKGMETTTFKRHKKMWAKHGPLELVLVKETSPGKFKTYEVIR
tara:strand:- start:74 stop:445 length:372 start_codon:yes stop_codon:yes gene_type:complete